MKLSLIIPTYTITRELEAVTCGALKSYQDQVDEIIVTEDGGFFSPALLDMSDVYLYHQRNQGFVKNVNEAWRLAKGDYIAIVNSDTSLHKGNLDDLCIARTITSPETIGQDVPLLAGHFFVVPRLLGTALLDEKLHTFCSDADLERRFWDHIQRVPSVEIYHAINLTLNAAKMLNEETLDRDRKVYTELCQK